MYKEAQGIVFETNIIKMVITMIVMYRMCFLNKQKVNYQHVNKGEKQNMKV